MKAAGISVVIPVWNRKELLGRTLDSLDGQTLRPDETIVVDNGSSDGAPELAEMRGARVIRMGVNTGFARAVNRGIRESRSEWVAVLNNDVELAPDWLARLHRTCTEAGAWFATGKLFNGVRRGEIDGAFDAVCRGGTAWRLGHGRPDGPAFSCERSIAIAPATAALFRAEFFSRAGYFEESFESYLEDVDLGLRAAARGLSGIFVPGALAWHAGSATLGRWNPAVVRLIARNQVLLVARHYPRRLLWRFAWPILAAQGTWGLVAARHGALWAFLDGKWAGLRRFRAARAASACLRQDSAAIERTLREGESEIIAVQRCTGFDWYWRIYVFLAGGGAK